MEPLTKAEAWSLALKREWKGIFQEVAAEVEGEVHEDAEEEANVMEAVAEADLAEEVAVKPIAAKMAYVAAVEVRLAGKFAEMLAAVQMPKEMDGDLVEEEAHHSEEYLE